MRHVLVTGGAGFIGSHLADRLLADGFRVTVFDNLSTGARENVPPTATLVEGDVVDAGAVRELFAGSRFDAVFHVAGQASIALSYATPERDLATNVVGTLNVLQESVAAGVARLVFASSMTVYGNPSRVPTPEDAPCEPASFYGVTKYAAERYVQLTGSRRDIGLAVTSLRMFNVYGERQSLSNPYQGVLAIFIGNALRGEPITIHSDGEQTRDFVYVGDVVEAWLRVLDAPETYGRVFNVGSGRETTINELANAVLGVFGESRETWTVGSAPEQAGDQRRSGADTSLVESTVGWRASLSLEDGMARTIGWARG